MLEVGGVIAGRYVLQQLIGEGGMASVWRAEDQTLKRQVAIKLLYVRGHRDPHVIVDQFLREARIAASVQHRNVIHTVDFGVAEESLPFMVMELLSGESLAARMAREPRLSMREVVHIASLTLRGLAAVHEAGIVHRDLKPQNIFLHQDTDAVYPKILDFGISRTLGSDHDRQSAISTKEGMIVGTPDYMSPEQARGEKDIDKRADIYSMGAILYEGITGRLPFDANTIGQLIVQIVTTTPKRMRELRPDVPEVLSDCIAQAMAPDREERFVDAQVFRRALTIAAGKAFPGELHADGLMSSEAPPAREPAQRVAPSAVREEAGIEELHGDVLAAAGVAGWGDFEGLSGGRASAQRAPGAPHGPRPPGAPPGQRPENAGRRAPEPLKRPAPRTGATAVVPPVPGNNPQPHDPALFGDSPFDKLGALQDAGSALDLDYAHHPAQRQQRALHHGAAGAGKKAGPPVRQGGAQDALRRPNRQAARSRPSWLWVLPALLLIGLGALLWAPGLLSQPGPDSPEAQARQARNTATLGSQRRVSSSRRTGLAKQPLPMRDVVF